MTKDEALKMALEALEYIEHNYMSLPAPAEKAITAIREALAQPEQEPVAVARVDDLERGGRVRALAMNLGLDAPLYTTPPHRKPLSDEMKSQCPYGSILKGAFYDGWLKAEAAHGIKGEA